MGLFPCETRVKRDCRKGTVISDKPQLPSMLKWVSYVRAGESPQGSAVLIQLRATIILVQVVGSEDSHAEKPLETGKVLASEPLGKENRAHSHASPKGGHSLPNFIQ